VCLDVYVYIHIGLIIYHSILFKQLGADWTFLEAPQSEAEMREYCRRVPGAKLANMLEYGDTPILSPRQLKEIGFTVAAYPLTLLSACVNTMQHVLTKLKNGENLVATTDASTTTPTTTAAAAASGDEKAKGGDRQQQQQQLLLDFQSLKAVVGFGQYNKEMNELLTAQREANGSSNTN
jgi:hypothetical protein